MGNDCLFCTPDELCVQHAAKASKRSPRKKVDPFAGIAAVPVAPAVVSSDSIQFAPTVRDMFGAGQEATRLTKAELELRECIILLWDMISPTEQYKLRDLIHPPKDAGLMKRREELRRKLDENE